MTDAIEEQPTLAPAPEQMTARGMMDDLAEESLLLAERKHLALSDAISIVAAVFNLLLTMPADPFGIASDTTEA